MEETYSVAHKVHIMLYGPIFFFFLEISISAIAYIEVLNTVVKPWIERVTQRMPYMLQKDAAPSHMAQMTKDYVISNMWPSSFSEYLKLLHLWGRPTIKSTASQYQKPIESHFCEHNQHDWEPTDPKM